MGLLFALWLLGLLGLVVGFSVPRSAALCQSSAAARGRARLAAQAASLSWVELQETVLSRVESSSGGSDLALERDVAQLELEAPRPAAFPSLWADLQGEWKLRYTNNARSNPTRRLGPFLEITEVIQKLGASADDDVENILVVRSPLTGTSGRVRLLHDCKVVSDTQPAQLAIDLRSVVYSSGADDQKRGGGGLCDRAGARAGLGAWTSALRRGFFDTTFVSPRLRVSRGLFGELRVFTR